MERTHCCLYQAAATDDCEDIMTSGKLLKLTRMFHVCTNPPWRTEPGIIHETPPIWRSPGRIQAMRALALVRVTGSSTRDFSEALRLVYRRLAEKKEEELLPAGGRLFCCFTL